MLGELSGAELQGSRKDVDDDDNNDDDDDDDDDDDQAWEGSISPNKNVADAWTGLEKIWFKAGKPRKKYCFVFLGN